MCCVQKVCVMVSNMLVSTGVMARVSPWKRRAVEKLCFFLILLSMLVGVAVLIVVGLTLTLTLTLTDDGDDVLVVFNATTLGIIITIVVGTCVSEGVLLGIDVGECVLPDDDDKVLLVGTALGVALGVTLGVVVGVSVG